MQNSCVQRAKNCAENRPKKDILLSDSWNFVVPLFVKRKCTVSINQRQINRRIGILLEKCSMTKNLLLSRIFTRATSSLVKPHQCYFHPRHGLSSTSLRFYTVSRVASGQARDKLIKILDEYRSAK